MKQHSALSSESLLNQSPHLMLMEHCADTQSTSEVEVLTDHDCLRSCRNYHMSKMDTRGRPHCTKTHQWIWPHENKRQTYSYRKKEEELCGDFVILMLDCELSWESTRLLFHPHEKPLYSGVGRVEISCNKASSNRNTTSFKVHIPIKRFLTSCWQKSYSRSCTEDTRKRKANAPLFAYTAVLIILCLNLDIAVFHNFHTKRWGKKFKTTRRQI